MHVSRIERTDARVLCAAPGCADCVEGDTLEGLIGQAYRELEISRQRAKTMLANARSEASEIVRAAHLEARQLLEAAVARSELEAESTRTRIEEEARRQGREEGLAAAAAETKGLVGTARQLRRSLECAYECHLRDAEAEILETVLAIARKVVGIEQEDFRDVLGAAVREVLCEQKEATQVTLTVNPEDYDSVVGEVERTVSVEKRVAGIAASESVPRGGCRFRSPAFNRDLAIDRRFEVIREKMWQQWEMSRPVRHD